MNKTEEPAKPVNKTKKVASKYKKKDNLWLCPHCFMGFKKLTEMKKHMVAHKGTKRKAYVCKTCNKRFTNSASLRVHMKIHSGTKPFPCTTCGKAFSQASTLRNHMQIHTGDFAFVCPHCDKGFAHVGNLKIHVRSHTGERPHICPTCGKTFILLRHLKNHMMVHTDERPFACQECDRSFRKSSHLSSHMSSHTRKQTLICSTCGYGFPTLARLRVHQLEHTGEEPFVCRECGKTFRLAAHLCMHMTKHTKPKNVFLCPICNIEFSTTKYLKSHMTHFHSKRHACNYCKKTFESKTILNLHMDKHGLFKCDSCPKLYISRPALMEHSKTHELDESNSKGGSSEVPPQMPPWAKPKPEQYYACPTCGLKFDQLKYLADHMKVHNGTVLVLLKNNSQAPSTSKVEQKEGDSVPALQAKKLDCPTCGQLFESPSMLSAHLETHRVETPAASGQPVGLGGAATSPYGDITLPMLSKEAMAHVCPICDQCFAELRHLKTHMSMKHGETPTTKSQKGWSLQEQNQLVFLEKSSGVPGADKPHVCPHCDKGFRLLRNLKTHMVCHKGKTR